jgi:hypothetical protein
MLTFKHKLYLGKRTEHECTQICACEAAHNPDAARWLSCAPDILDKLTHLYTESGVRYYGYM